MIHRYTNDIRHTGRSKTESWMKHFFFAAHNNSIVLFFYSFGHPPYHFIVVSVDYLFIYSLYLKVKKHKLLKEISVLSASIVQNIIAQHWLEYPIKFYIFFFSFSSFSGLVWFTWKQAIIHSLTKTRTAKKKAHSDLFKQFVILG